MLGLCVFWSLENLVVLDQYEKEGSLMVMKASDKMLYVKPLNWGLSLLMMIELKVI